MPEPSLRRICLFDGVGQAWCAGPQVADALGRWLTWCAVEVRGDLLAEGVRGADEATVADLALRLCQLRVWSPAQRLGEQPRRPLKPELDYERRRLQGTARAAPGVVYDGHELQRLALRRLPAADAGLDVVAIWLTERLFATWDEADGRYHARVSLYGFPALLSTTGMVQAPARERAYYLARRLRLAPEQAAAGAAGFLDYEDPRTTEVAKGYALQAVFYALTGEPFCDEPRCRLFNAHWQREMLAAQIGGGDFCPRHREALRAWEAAAAVRGCA